MTVRGPTQFAVLIHRRAFRVACMTLTGVLILAALLELVTVLDWVRLTGSRNGADFAIYLDRTRSWLAGSGFYRSSQLAGVSYVIQIGDATYPPPILVLLLPFMVLPAALWWAIPLGIIAVSLWRLRPPYWTWPLMLAALCHPLQLVLLVYGNPGMWAHAALVAGFSWGRLGPLAALKPTIAPFALVHVRRDDFWIGVALLAAVALLFAPMWPDYVNAMLHAQSPAGLGYLLGEWPLAGALALAGVASTRTRHSVSGRPSISGIMIE